MLTGEVGFGAEFSGDLAEVEDVRVVGYVLQHRLALPGDQGRREQGQGAVFGPADGDVAVQRAPAVND